VGIHPHFHPALENLTFDKILSESLSKFSEGKWVLSYISRLDNAHGIDLYLQIIRRCLDKNIDICGVIIGRQGTDLGIDDYKHLLNKYQLDDNNIYLKLGKYSYEELLSVLSITDCVLAPYRFISQSGAIALALGEKIPVIASNVGANSEMIRDNVNGLLFDVEDIDSVVDKIALIYSQGISMKENFPFNESFNNHLDPHQWLNILLNALD
jgi:glycosyltransferase involved in cell wall biosynthesis